VKLKILKRLLTRYHEGTANNAERFVVDRWYDSFGSDAQVPGIENEEEAEETGHRIFNRIGLWKTVKPWYYRQGFQIACSVIMISAVLLFLYGRQTQHSTIANPIVYQTAKGEARKILLTDNTTIWLNADSRLEILPAYAKGKREIRLTGEAYFEVKHNPEQPFIVHAGELTTNVLGTSFTVQAYQKSRFARVTLLTGKVWVKVTHPGPGKPSGAMLLPDQSLQYDYHAKTITKTNVASSASSKAWIDGKLIFDSTPMPEAAEILSRAFGFHINLDGSKFNNCRIYGQFNMTDRPEKVIRIICKMIGASYTMQGNQVSIKGEGCK
jgi:transmembrane sensor